MWITSYLKSNEPFEVRSHSSPVRCTLTLIFLILPKAYSRIPLCIRYTRLMIISQVILSGFELELYTQSEWAMMYWYLAEVLSVQITVLNDIYSSLLQETSTPDIEQAIGFVTCQRDYVHGLQGISLALRDVHCFFSLTSSEILIGNVYSEDLIPYGLSPCPARC